MRNILTICDWCHAKAYDDQADTFWTVTLQAFKPGAMYQVEVDGIKRTFSASEGVQRTYHCCHECAKKGLTR